MSEPSLALRSKAMRLAATGRVTRTPAGYIVRGDSGVSHSVYWHQQRERWECVCNARGQQCSHILAVQYHRQLHEE